MSDPVFQIAKKQLSTYHFFQVRLMPQPQLLHLIPHLHLRLLSNLLDLFRLTALNLLLRILIVLHLLLLVHTTHALPTSWVIEPKEVTARDRNYIAMLQLVPLECLNGLAIQKRHRIITAIDLLDEVVHRLSRLIQRRQIAIKKIQLPNILTIIYILSNCHYQLK